MFAVQCISSHSLTAACQLSPGSREGQRARLRRMEERSGKEIGRKGGRTREIGVRMDDRRDLVRKETSGYKWGRNRRGNGQWLKTLYSRECKKGGKRARGEQSFIALKRLQISQIFPVTNFFCIIESKLQQVSSRYHLQEYKNLKES